MEARLVSMKYQLSVEETSIKMTLKKMTNLVRRLTNRGLPAVIRLESALGVSEGAMADSVRLIDKVIDFFRKFNTQESRGLQIDRDLEPFDWYRLHRRPPIPVQDTLCQQPCLAADFPVGHRQAQEGTERGEFRGESDHGNPAGQRGLEDEPDRVVRQHGRIRYQPERIGCGKERAQLLRHLLFILDREFLKLERVSRSLRNGLLELGATAGGV